jgi:hypothetical protein
MEKKKQEYCECCGQPVINYKTTFTKRNLIWLYSLGWIGKYKNADNNYWTNYKEVHELVGKNFGKFVNGKWKPMVLSAYGRMADAPYQLIENDNDDKEKFRSKGDWRLSEKGIAFINNKIQIPEEAHYNHEGCYKHSRMIYAHEVKGINFQELVDLFNSF